MKILLAHAVHSSGIDKWYAEIAASAGPGIDVTSFSVTLDSPGPRLSWRELDQRWLARDKKLLNMYRRLQQVAAECDVLLLYNGTNIHPEFLDYLPTYNIYCCFDDPESSSDLSAPVAASFDAAFFGNIAARFQYENYGCKRMAWLPVFTAPSDVPTFEEGERLIAAGRDVDVSLVCERNELRRRRLDMLAGAFPQAKCFGKGWDAGRIDEKALHDLYRRSRIGWNIHNSTGPINRRMFALAGYGALQICDNKTGLGHIFELGREVVGFDTIPEAIDLTRYYLAHDYERQEIAFNARRRFWQDYHAGAIWQRIKNQTDMWMKEEYFTAKKPLRDLPSKTPLSVAKSCIRSAKQMVVKNSYYQQISAATLYSKSSNKHELDERVYLRESVPVYIENPEMKGVNMAKERLAKGEPFEWPNMLAQNWAATTLIRDAKRIVEIGSGTGPFSHFAAVDRSRVIHCFEEDDFAREWAEEHRSHPNVSYFKHYDENLGSGYDLVVSFDVFEHVADMRGFLSFCCKLAPRAIYSTPNRKVVRPPDDMGPPAYPPHVREFAPGELYWLLRQYYCEVALYYLPDIYVPWLEPMTINTHGSPIIAECSAHY